MSTRLQDPLGEAPDAPLGELGSPLPSLRAGGGRKGVSFSRPARSGANGGGGVGKLIRFPLRPSRQGKQQAAIVARQQPAPKPKNTPQAQGRATLADVAQASKATRDSRERRRSSVLSGNVTTHRAPVENPAFIPKTGETAEEREAHMETMHKRDARFYFAMPADIQDRYNYKRREDVSNDFDRYKDSIREMIEADIDMLNSRPKNARVRAAGRKARRTGKSPAQSILDQMAARDRMANQAQAEEDDKVRRTHDVFNKLKRSDLGETPPGGDVGGTKLIPKDE